VKFQYSQIKNTFMGTAVILQIANAKCTTTHPNDHSREVSFQSDKKIYLTFMFTMAMTTILKMSIGPKNNFPVRFYSKPQLFRPLKIYPLKPQRKISNLYAQLDT
jgi:hypothetical protein